MPIKKIIVTSANWKETIQVDSDVFEDVYIEACTRAIEKMAKKKKINIGSVMVCWESGDSKNPVTCNSYKMLINAGLHYVAAAAKKNLSAQGDIDWESEPFRSSAKK